MKKELKKRDIRGQHSLKLYATCACAQCSCSGCSGTPSWNYVATRDARTSSAAVYNAYAV